MTPDGWERTTFGGIVEHLSRGSVPQYASADTGIYAVNQRCVRDLRVSITSVRPHDPSRKIKPGALLRDGDVCINSTGNGTIGRVGLWRQPSSGSFFVDTHVTVARAKRSRVVPKFLVESLAAPEMQRRLERECFTGSTNQMELSSSALAALSVALPPIPVQRKIADISSSVDDVIENTEAVIEELQAVKKAMMRELLTRGLPGRHTRFKKTVIGEVPEDWEIVRAADVCALITKGATPEGQTPDVGDVRFLKVYNIDPAGFIDFEYRPSFVPKSVHDGELKRSRVLPHDVLMNIVGPPLGKVAVVPAGWPESNVNQAIAVFRPSKIESEYLAMCLSLPHIFVWASARAKRTSTQLNLTLELCRDYPIPLPGPRERQVILGMWNSISTRLLVEVRLLNSLRETKAALMSVLLSGKLPVTPDKDAA